ncbi:MAG: ANTAR domain-containing protein, partial [Clostridiales bacterium]|nr:ANTAR domain-containing protein [Clostridiales bacterium]
RAKCVLISYLAMSEPEAHKYIEKQSMDMQKTKRVIAEGIVRTYEN